jgi:hypothetical protein
MALGTISTPVAKFVAGNRRYRTVDVQLTSGANYTTGGETITAAQAGMKFKIEHVIGGPALTTSGTTSRTAVPLYQTDGSVKLLVQTTASAEAASNSDQSTFTARLTFVGR